MRHTMILEIQIKHAGCIVTIILIAMKVIIIFHKSRIVIQYICPSRGPYFEKVWCRGLSCEIIRKVWEPLGKDNIDKEHPGIMKLEERIWCKSNKSLKFLISGDE